METIPPKTTSKYLRSEIAGNVFGNHVTDNMAGEGSFVLCYLHNYIGSKLEYDCPHDWQGHISPDSKYPNPIEDAASGHFKHVADERGKPKAAVVYRTKEGNPFYWVICWEVAGGGNNRVYTEIQNHKPNGWDAYESKVQNGKDKSEFTFPANEKTFKATVEIDSDNTKLIAKIEKI